MMLNKILSNRSNCKFQSVFYDPSNTMMLPIIFCAFLMFGCSLQAKPNVLFIVVDDLRPALGVYGDKTAFTPNIDRLAKRSIVFHNAYAQQALCAPSRNSFLTSRRPDSLHLYDFYSYWRDVAGNFTTLPQHFKEHGYHTHSIGKIFHPGISSNWTDDAQYSWSEKPYHPPTEIFKEAKVCPTAKGTRAKNLVCPVITNEQPGGTLPDLESLNEALNFLTYRENSVDNKPYFLAVGFHKPHVPLKYPIQYLQLHPLNNITLPTNRQRPSLLPTVAWNPWTDVRNRDDISSLNLSFPFGTMPDYMTRRIIQSYNAAVSYIDDLIGQLIQSVDDNTIIVLTGDHGWSLSEHGEFSKFSNFENSVRVPLLIHVPNLTKRRDCQMLSTDNLVELVDLFPTLVDLTKVSDSLPTCTADSSNCKLCTEGKSLVPMIASTLQGKQFTGKEAVFNQYPRPGLYPSKYPNSDKPRLKDIKIMGYSIRTKQHRYTEWVSFDNNNCTPNWSKTLDRELYDHFIDPDENMNLASRSELNSIIKELSHKLRQGWRHVK